MSTATSRARVSPITAAHGSRLLPIEVCVRTAGVLRLKRSASASPLEVATGTVRVATKVKTSASRPCRRRAPAHTATSAVAMAANGSSTTTACTTSTCTGSPEMVFSPTVGEPPDDCRPNGIRTRQLSHQLSHRRRRRRVVSYPAHRVRHAALRLLQNEVSGPAGARRLDILPSDRERPILPTGARLPHRRRPARAVAPENKLHPRASAREPFRRVTWSGTVRHSPAQRGPSDTSAEAAPMPTQSESNPLAGFGPNEWLV